MSRSVGRTVPATGPALMRTASAAENRGGFNVGDTCEAFYVEDGKYYKAEVVRVLDGGKYRVNYLEYSYERDLKASELRPLPGSAPKVVNTDPVPHKPSAGVPPRPSNLGSASYKAPPSQRPTGSVRAPPPAPSKPKPAPVNPPTHGALPPRPHTTALAPSSGVTAVALYEFRAVKASEIDLNPGDEIINVQQTGQWWTGTLNGRTGKFPYNYVQIKTEASGGGDGGAIPVPPRPTLRPNSPRKREMPATPTTNFNQSAAASTRSGAAPPPRPANMSMSASVRTRVPPSTPLDGTMTMGASVRKAPPPPVHSATLTHRSAAPTPTPGPPPVSPRKAPPPPVATPAPLQPATRPPPPAAAKPPVPVPSKPTPAPPTPKASIDTPTPPKPAAVPPRPSAPAKAPPATNGATAYDSFGPESMRMKRTSTKKLPPPPAAGPKAGGGIPPPPPVNGFVPPPPPVMNGGGVPTPPPVNGFHSTPAPAATHTPPVPTKRSAPTPPAASSSGAFKVKESISAKWREDGQWYNAVIDRVFDEGGVVYYDITFTEYGNNETYYTKEELKKLPGAAAAKEDDGPAPPPGSFAAALAAKANKLHQTGLKKEDDDVVEIALPTKAGGGIASSLIETRVTKKALAMSVYMPQDKLQGVDDAEWEDDDDACFDF